MSTVSGRSLWSVPSNGNIWEMEIDKSTCLQDLEEHYDGSTLFARIQRLFFRCVICCSKLAYAEWRGIWSKRVEHDKMAQKVERLFQAAISRLCLSAVVGCSLAPYELEKSTSKWESEAKKLLDKYDYKDDREKELVLQGRKTLIMRIATSYA